uniref:Putative pheromone receptor protein isoform 5 n=2 Tax=Flammulina TaxID=38944 RepID=A0A6C0N1S8_9AGAR|nr:putative pheromone receptor [Flammulina velutipes]QHW03267.1 putative pheromone receptor protein isoform 5 [Flammulina filiformis]
MTDPTYPLFPICAFLGFVISLVPLPWHLQAWNSGTCAFMIWTATMCLVQFVNAIIWKDNMDNIAPIWCDISTQIILACSIGMPASILCISRRLYKITSIQSVSVTRKDKRKDVLIDMCIAVGVPLLVLGLHTIVHAHRFDILEQIGCYPVTFNTLPSYFLFYMWPILLGCTSFVYSGLTLRSFFIRRAQFTSLLSSTSVTHTRYIRLMALSVCDMSFTVPFAIYVMYIGTAGIPLSPWISWDDTHYNWLRVQVVPAQIWRGISGYQITVELTRWLSVFCAFTFFALFGFASEAKKNYRKAFGAVSKLVGLAPKPKLPVSWHKHNGKLDSQATLPVYTVSHPPPKPKLTSFGDTDEFEMGLYSPGAEKGGFPSPTSYTASRCPSYDETVATSIDVEAGSTRLSHDEISISSAHPPSLSPPAPVLAFEDSFKPLPPLPWNRHCTASLAPQEFAFSPYGPPLRHASSMPLPPRQEFPIPLYHSCREREGSLTVVVEQTTRIDAR